MKILKTKKDLEIEKNKKLEELGKLLKSMRQDRGLTLKQVSEMTSIPVTSINGYELGKVDPSATKLITLLEYYGVNPSLFMIEKEQWIRIDDLNSVVRSKIISLVTKARNLMNHNHE